MAMMIRSTTSATGKTTRVSDISLWEATSVNTKVVASYATIAAGYVVGGFKSAASTAVTHAANNKGGHVDNILTTTIKEHFVEAEAKGFNMVEDVKDYMDFDFAVGTASKPNTEKTTATPNNNNNTGA